MDWIKLFKRNHYFIVCYIATHQKGQLTGQSDFVCSNTFLDRAKTMKDLQASIPEAHDFVITNIIHITKKEYAIWKSKY